MDSGFTWTRHVEHGGYFRCPDDALDDWVARGWIVSDPPEPGNPATAEQPGRQQTTPDTPAASRGTLAKEVDRRG